MRQRLRRWFVDGWPTPAIGGLVGAALFIAYLAGAELLHDHWVPIVDSFNLALHEAGHPLFGLLSNRLMVYGGTIMQLLFPLAIALSFLRRRDVAGTAVGVAWLGQNLLNVARYLGDARSQVLPLAGGGEHDWGEILGRWGWLRRDHAIARGVGAVGWLLLVAAISLLLWAWLRRARDQPGSPG
jgi:hypothetical protein